MSSSTVREACRRLTPSPHQAAWQQPAPLPRARLHDERVLARALARVPEPHGAVHARGREGVPGAVPGTLPLHLADNATFRASRSVSITSVSEHC